MTPTKTSDVPDVVSDAIVRPPYAHNDTWNKCDVCGRFFSFADIESGKATHKMITPDSDWSSEEWESLCAKHAEPNKKVSLAHPKKEQS